MVYNKGYLHNDLNLDNIVIGNSLNGKLKPYIIDFGKACPILSRMGKSTFLVIPRRKCTKRSTHKLHQTCVMALWNSRHLLMSTHLGEL
jgi:serine/threonine protein kinase